MHPEITRLLKLLDLIEEKINDFEKSGLSISKSSVGWHIEHTLLTIIQIVDALKYSKLDNYKWKFSWSKLLVYSLNKIPRGRAKAPKTVQPQGLIVKENLISKFQNARSKLKELPEINPNSYFEHPFFGHLKLKPTIRFLEIHTKHHLEIIDDIIKSK